MVLQHAACFGAADLLVAFMTAGLLVTGDASALARGAGVAGEEVAPGFGAPEAASGSNRLLLCARHLCMGLCLPRCSQLQILFHSMNKCK